MWHAAAAAAVVASAVVVVVASAIAVGVLLLLLWLPRPPVVVVMRTTTTGPPRPVGVAGKLPSLRGSYCQQFQIAVVANVVVALAIGVLAAVVVSANGYD